MSDIQKDDPLIEALSEDKQAKAAVITDPPTPKHKRRTLVGIICAVIVLVIIGIICAYVFTSAPAPVVAEHGSGYQDIANTETNTIDIVKVADLTTDQSKAFDVLTLTNRGTVATTGKLPINPKPGDTYYIEVTKHYVTFLPDDDYTKTGNGVWVDTGDGAVKEIGEIVPDTDAITELDTNLGSSAGGVVDTPSSTTWHPAEYRTVHHDAVYQDVYHPSELIVPEVFGSARCDCGFIGGGNSGVDVNSFLVHVDAHVTAGYSTGRFAITPAVWSDPYTEHVLITDVWDEQVLVREGYWS
ncbi:hypothetical protein FACS1894104_2000 [Actinomycetota bacterium]|nr:hypothetical protein FACS1894104_2000 [Actinomycetota bacterium]